MNTKTVALIAVAAVLIGGWYVYRENSAGTDYRRDESIEYNDSLNTPVTVVPETASTSTRSDEKMPEVMVKEFTINSSNFSFSPKVVTVNKGESVKITLVNAGGMHDLKIDEFNVATPKLQSGQSATITFVADKVGSFEYYCSMGEHRQMGMRGTLIVK